MIFKISPDFLFTKNFLKKNFLITVSIEIFFWNYNFSRKKKTSAFVTKSFFFK